MKFLKNLELPEEVKELFFNIVYTERDYIGEKHIENGFLIKRNKNRATISYDDGEQIYIVKMVCTSNKWKIIGRPTILDNIKDLLFL